MLRIADRMEANLDRLAQAETWDNGKLLQENAVADVPTAIEQGHYFAGGIRAQEASMGKAEGVVLLPDADPLPCGATFYP